MEWAILGVILSAISILVGFYFGLERKTFKRLRRYARSQAARQEDLKLTYLHEPRIFIFSAVQTALFTILWGVPLLCGLIVFGFERFHQGSMIAALPSLLIVGASLIGMARSFIRTKMFVNAFFEAEKLLVDAAQLERVDNQHEPKQGQVD